MQCNVACLQESGAIIVSMRGLFESLFWWKHIIINYERKEIYYFISLWPVFKLPTAIKKSKGYLLDY
jgi:hypothetical protein